MTFNPSLGLKECEDILKEWWCICFMWHLISALCSLCGSKWSVIARTRDTGNLPQTITEECWMDQRILLDFPTPTRTLCIDRSKECRCREKWCWFYRGLLWKILIFCLPRDRKSKLIYGSAQDKLGSIYMYL